MPFYRNLLSLTFLLIAGVGALYYYTGYTYVHPLAWYMVGFFALITALTFYVVQKGSDSDPGSFQLFFMGSSVLRVLLCMMAVFLYVFLANDRELQFTLNFFIFYFIYTGFEIYSILSNLRRNSKRQASK